MMETNSVERHLAQLSLLAGGSAVAVTAVFAYLNGGLTSVGLPSLEGAAGLIGFVLSALAFQYGTPFLCSAALLLGVRTRDSWPGRIGIIAGLLALVPYVVFLRTLYELVSA